MENELGGKEDYVKGSHIVALSHRLCKGSPPRVLPW